MASSLVRNFHCTVSLSGCKVGNHLHSQNSNLNSIGTSAWLDFSRPLSGKHWAGSQARTIHYIKTGPIPVHSSLGQEGSEDGEGDGTDASKDISAELFRQRIERMMNNDDARFEGKDLATLIRNKYGRSYDVQLIKKEFMGRQLLAMNVMWKYREQRSFPLTEEEYLLHLDAVAENLRLWGAVSTIRDTLSKTKERPRIGKAVSIFIDLDETGGRAKEWINR